MSRSFRSSDAFADKREAFAQRRAARDARRAEFDALGYDDAAALADRPLMGETRREAARAALRW